MFLNIIKHKLFKNTAIYTISTLIKRSIPFLILPILTRYLTPEEYGIIATFQVLLAVMMVFVSMNADSAVSINYFKLEKKDFKIYVWNAAIIFFVSFALIFTLVFALKSSIANCIKFSENWLMITVFAALCHSVISLTIILWQAEQRPIPYGIFQILQSILNVGISVILIVGLGMKWEGRLLGIVIAYAFFGFLGGIIIYKRRYIKFEYNGKYIKDALIYGAGLIPYSLSWCIVSGIDRLFINSMVSVSATGIYSVGNRIAVLIGLLIDSFNRAWAPFLFEKLKQDNFATKVKIVRFTYFSFLGIIILTILFIIIAPFILKFFVGKNFYPAEKFILWIAIGQAFNGLRYLIVNYIFYTKKTYIFSTITIFTALVNAVLNFCFIKSYGAIGAAYATTVTYLIDFVLTWILSAKVYKMPWFDKAILASR
jgi:O-antigen/teichoic acid export membrane protein